MSEQPVKRFIRLKEFGSGINRVVSPSPDYLGQTNGSLPPGDRVIRTDSSGYIRNGSEPTGAINRTIVTGDSFVECSFLDEGDRLCDRLTELFGGESGRVFLNAGYSGSTSLNIYNIVLNKVLAADKSLIFVLPSNDVLSLLNGDGYWDLRDKRYSPIVPYIRQAINPGEFDDNLDQTSKLLQSLVAMCDIFNVNLTLVTFPHVQANYNALPWFRRRYGTEQKYNALIEKRCRANKALRIVASDNKVHFIDLEAAIRDESLFYDDLHLNSEGSRAAARFILDSGVDF